MKNKASLFATAATLAFIGTSSGQTVIDLTGSTAGRSAVVAAVKALLVGESVAWVGNANENRGDAQIYYGGTVGTGGPAVTVRMFWSGSAAGVRDISNAPQLNNSYIAANYATAGRNDSAPRAAASAETVSEIGFSDVFQTSTAFTTNTLANEVQVAVLPFVFMKNDGAPATLTNMTPPLFAALYGGLGELRLSMFTGSNITAENDHIVYASGRNDESGTRITSLANCYYPLTLGINQYSGSGDPAVLTFEGNGGYPSGGNVATLLSATTAPGTSLVAYVGITDGITAATGGASYLKFNGVDYTAENVQNGLYSQWGYLHQSTMLDVTQVNTTTNFYKALRDALILAPGTGTLNLATMRVERAADGAAITPK